MTVSHEAVWIASWRVCHSNLRHRFNASRLLWYCKVAGPQMHTSACVRGVGRDPPGALHVSSVPLM